MVDREGCTILHRYAQAAGNRDWGRAEPPLLKLLLSYPTLDLEARNSDNARPIDMIGFWSRNKVVYKRLAQEMKRRQAESTAATGGMGQ
jgi:hypothetical protein